MSARLERVRSWLIAPPVERERPVPVVRAAPRHPEVAVLAAPKDVYAIASSLALRLGAGTAVVALWTGEDPSPRAPAPAAMLGTRRLAVSLAARGLAARAAGRLVTVALPAAERVSAETAARVCGAVADAPVVLAAGGPRGEAWDRVLVERDLVAVHARDPVLAELAVDRLSDQGACAVRLTAAPAAPVRLLARAGLALPGGADGLAPALEAVGR